MHIINLKVSLTMLIASVAVVGCASQSPVLDAHFGDAVNAAKAQQIINPEASQNTETVVGFDGQVGNAVIDRYHRSYQQPPVSPNVFNIGVGTSSGASTGSTGAR